MTTPSPTDLVRVRASHGFTGHYGSAQFQDGELVGWRGDRATRLPRGEAERLCAILGHVVGVIENEPEPEPVPPTPEHVETIEDLPLAPPTPPPSRARRARRDEEREP